MYMFIGYLALRANPKNKARSLVGPQLVEQGTHLLEMGFLV